jgi:MFS family permease
MASRETSEPVAVERYRWVILLLGILAYATSLFARQNYSGVQKFVAHDLRLDKAALGLLGSVFFYSYAVFQMPWGIASDRFGSRWITGLGILLTALAMAGFAMAQSLTGLVLWRCASGVAGAAAYVAMSGGLACWFPKSERGFSQAALGGVGGALGEGAAFFLLPIISIYFASGWRQGMSVIAALIAIVGVLCLIFLRSGPIARPRASASPFDWTLLGDPTLWSHTFLFCAFIVGLRGTQTWLVVYVTEVYLAKAHLALNDAVVAGGLLVTVTYSLLGRGLGCPLGGKLSDILAKRGVSRVTLAVAWLSLAVTLLLVLAIGVSTTAVLGLIALLLGVSVNLFPLISASISEVYGAGKTASIVAFVNMMGQFSGASVLAASGFLGIALSSQAGNALAEYRGIWLSGMVGVASFTILGASTHLALKLGWLAKAPSTPIGTRPRSLPASR